MAVDRYPESRISPVLGLGLEGMSVNAADDMLILDTSVSPAPFSANVTGFGVARIISGNLGSGNNDLYTVPAGKRAVIAFTAFNTAGTSTAIKQQVKFGGTGSYYPFTGVGGTSVSTVSQTNSSDTLVLEAGDIWSMNTSQAGMNVFATVYLFDNTAKVKSPRLTSMSSGDNTLYTCPLSTVAYLIGTPSFIWGSSNNPLFRIANISGGALSYKLNIVLSGGSPGLTNQISPTTSVPNNDIVGLSQGPFSLSAGDYISVNTTGSGSQYASCVVAEVPA